MIQLTEYSLSLTTGERIDVSELDPGLLGEEWSEAVAAAVRPLTDMCAHVPREAVEAAKLGYDTELKRLLRDPVGCLVMLDRPVCSVIRDCPMAVREKCTTRNATARKGGLFPVCWEWQVPDDLDPVLEPAVQAAAQAIVHAWRQKRHVLVVTG